MDIRVPDLSAEVAEATIGDWLKKVGDTIKKGDVLLILETDKVSAEIFAEADGVLTQIVRQTGEDVKSGEVLGVITPATGVQPAPVAAQPAATPEPAPRTSPTATPVAQRAAQSHGVDLAQVTPSDGQRITKQDVISATQPKPATPAPAAVTPQAAAPSVNLPEVAARRETRSKMTRRRRTIAKRLVEAQATAAMLTTFNEVDMKPVQDVRARRKAAFQEKYGVGLGLSSFFVKATISALKRFPQLNAEIAGDEMILKSYYDIGMAIGAEEGLIVPVIRDADRLSFAEIEQQIRAFAKQAQDGTLPLEALMGGTFTITNGGVFGSLLSTPILNMPQVGILGLHGIKERPVVVNGEIVVRPMMYLALTYDHRIVDGREAVQFLVHIKDMLEDPERLLIEG